MLMLTRPTLVPLDSTTRNAGPGRTSHGTCALIWVGLTYPSGGDPVDFDGDPVQRFWPWCGAGSQGLARQIGRDDTEQAYPGLGGRPRNLRHSRCLPASTKAAPRVR